MRALLLLVLAACGSAPPTRPPAPKPVEPVKPVAEAELAPLHCSISLRVMQLDLLIERGASSTRVRLSGRDVRDRDGQMSIIKPLSGDRLPALFTREGATGLELRFSDNACTSPERGLYACEGPAEIRYVDSNDKPLADPPMIRPVQLKTERYRTSTADGGDRDAFALFLLLTDEEPASWMKTDVFHECQ